MFKPGVVEIDERIARLIRGDDCDYDELAVALYRFQSARCDSYRVFCERHLEGRQVAGWRDVPAVPVGSFQTQDYRTFPVSRTVATFQTSGTTSGVRGCHHFDSLELYRMASMRSFGAAFLPDVERILVVSLIPYSDDSSLARMVQWVLDEFGLPGSATDVTGALLSDSRQPVLLLGTAVGLANLFESKPQLRLPPGSRVMETGGFKGRRKPLTRDEMFGFYQRAGIAPEYALGEYGMTELSSQWYEGVVGQVSPLLSERAYEPAPWARTRVIDPLTMVDVADGEVGLLLHYDPVNRGSVAAILTADLGRRVGDGFQYRGRVPGAGLRGCSLRETEG